MFAMHPKYCTMVFITQKHALSQDSDSVSLIEASPKCSMSSISLSLLFPRSPSPPWKLCATLYYATFCFTLVIMPSPFPQCMNEASTNIRYTPMKFNQICIFTISRFFIQFQSDGKVHCEQQGWMQNSENRGDRYMWKIVFCNYAPNTDTSINKKYTISKFDLWWDSITWNFVDQLF